MQDLVTGVENADTVAAYINVETPTGTIALKKTSEDGVVEGIQFTISKYKIERSNKTKEIDKGVFLVKRKDETDLSVFEEKYGYRWRSGR